MALPATQTAVLVRAVRSHLTRAPLLLAGRQVAATAPLCSLPSRPADQGEDHRLVQAGARQEGRQCARARPRCVRGGAPPRAHSGTTPHRDDQRRTLHAMWAWAVLSSCLFLSLAAMALQARPRCASRPGRSTRPTSFAPWASTRPSSPRATQPRSAWRVREPTLAVTVGRGRSQGRSSTAATAIARALLRRRGRGGRPGAR